MKRLFPNADPDRVFATAQSISPVPERSAAGFAQLAALEEREFQERQAQFEQQAWLNKEALVYLSCEATFVIKNDRIESVVYKGVTGEQGAKDFMCAYIVEDCLKRSR